jgi:FtsH-binding integral membrane protein
MNQFNFNQTTTVTEDRAIAKTFMSNVFSWMTLALVVSGVFAYMFGTNMSLLSYLINMETGSWSILGYVAIFSPFVMILAMNFGFDRMSFGTLVILFGVFAALMGMSMSTIFLVFTMASIVKVFFISAATFGAMALLGYTTKTDLTKLGSILYMALIGIIIASVINFFMQSAQMDYIISILGVLIFTGLTAYDVQKLKRIGQGLQFQSTESNKLVIMGALTLYLDFINLFLFLLRLLGDRK